MGVHVKDCRYLNSLLGVSSYVGRCESINHAIQITKSEMATRSQTVKSVVAFDEREVTRNVEEIASKRNKVVEPRVFVFGRFIRIVSILFECREYGRHNFLTHPLDGVGTFVARWVPVVGKDVTWPRVPCDTQ